MTLQLRPYQADLLSDIETRFHYSAHAVMMQLPHRGWQDGRRRSLGRPA